MAADDVQVRKIVGHALDVFRVRIIDEPTPKQSRRLRNERHALLLTVRVDRIQDRVVQVAAGGVAGLDEHRAQVQYFDASAQFRHGVVHLVARVDAGDADEAPGARALHFGLQVVGRRARGKVEAPEPRPRIAAGNRFRRGDPAPSSSAKKASCVRSRRAGTPSIFPASVTLSTK